MSSYPKVIEAVKSVLKTKAVDGETTKQAAVIMVLRKIEQQGGPGKFGIGAAAMRWALQHIVDTEVNRQLKIGLSEHAKLHMLPPTIPMDVVDTLGKVPAWIAIGEGPEAIWKHSLKATMNDWIANSKMKEKKAFQTARRANASMDVARFLQTYKFNSLEDAFK